MCWQNKAAAWKKPGILKAAIRHFLDKVNLSTAEMRNLRRSLAWPAAGVGCCADKPGQPDMMSGVAPLSLRIARELPYP
jgi:hypothetical protein